MEIQVDGEQWPMAAGCIGLAKLYSEEELPRTATGILLKDDILDSLAEKFIRGLIDQFSVVKREVKKNDVVCRPSKQTTGTGRGVRGRSSKKHEQSI
ncbi:MULTISPECIES: hypothetical protein [Bacillus]|jgi:CRISPR-associated protein Cst1|uniref:hypothetical protein n=1 Tax=Bacillus TaxID=1386 RepID=UPI00065E8159|nr:hypothetical protein [Bacillus smithii]MED4885226.1 hypothetical protein [Bacillus smithii]MED4926130.1 hypothetical protein [Bacillus smithii]